MEELSKELQQKVIEIFEEADKLNAEKALALLKELRDSLTDEEIRQFQNFITFDEEYKELILRICRKVYKLII